MGESGGCSPIIFNLSIDEQPVLTIATDESRAQRNNQTRCDIELPFTQNFHHPDYSAARGIITVCAGVLSTTRVVMAFTVTRPGAVMTP
jgi:hypothetical protein